VSPLLITLLAEEQGNTGPDFGKASPVGLLVVVLLLIGVFALVWSMNRELKKVPQSFDQPPDATAATAAADSTPVSDELAGEPKGESGG
jgi:hypothetical protein